VITRRTGRVLDASGQPVSGAVVAVASGTAPTPEIGIRTRSDGRFTVALPPGTFQLEARTPEGAVGRLEVSSEPGEEGEEGEEIVIRLGKTETDQPPG
jgi:hypothetical protein